MAWLSKVSLRVYSLLYYAALPGILLRLLWRSRHTIGYRQRWNERFGYIKPLSANTKSIWIHAVSVGESMAAILLIKQLQKQFSDYLIVVTTTTPSGSILIRQQLRNEVAHYYAPFDLPGCVNRFLRLANIQLCIILETELWPNMLRGCRKFNIPVFLANARMSERSKRKYQWIPQITRSMLASYAMVGAQGLLDGERFIELGLHPTRLTIAGNIKFDIDINTNILSTGQALRAAWQATNRPIFIAASTHDGEEAMILSALQLIQAQIPNVLLVLAPRHANRSNKVARLCGQAGFTVTLRSEKKSPKPNTDIFIVDTTGELPMIYAACDVAFVGGSLVKNVGGHNLIEPAAVGLPILMGPHVDHCLEISQLLCQAGAAKIIHDAKSMAELVIALFTAKELCQKMGIRAHEVIHANRGALNQHILCIKKILLGQPIAN